MSTSTSSGVSVTDLLPLSIDAQLSLPKERKQYRYTLKRLLCPGANEDSKQHLYAFAKEIKQVEEDHRRRSVEQSLTIGLGPEFYATLNAVLSLYPWKCEQQVGWMYFLVFTYCIMHLNTWARHELLQPNDYDFLCLAKARVGGTLMVGRDVITGQMIDVTTGQPSDVSVGGYVRLMLQFYRECFRLVY